MVKSRAVLVVGHSSWGKSRTLRALTGNLHRRVTFNGKSFLVRRMSNDDVEKGYEDFINDLDPENEPFVIIAYCPEDSPRPFITALGKKYELFLWVIKHKYKSSEIINAEEIRILKEFGTVKCYAQPNADDLTRAAALEGYIDANV